MRRLLAALVFSTLALAQALAFDSMLVLRAESYVGKSASDLGLPSHQWCADFINMLLGGGTHSRRARDFVKFGHRTSYGCTGCIAVMARGKNGGHVGVVKGYDQRGNPIIISGNHNRRVGEGVYARSRVYAYVIPQ